LQAQNSKVIRERKKDTYETVDAKTPAYTSNLKYLADVLHGKIQPGIDLSSLDNNLIVVKILEAARKSAQEGKRIVLK